MEKETTDGYIKCRNCGKFCAANESIGNVYCSEICASTFSRCPNCGRFFSAGDGTGGFCSTECSAVYTKDGLLISTKEKERL